MMKFSEKYQELREKYSDEEIVDAMLIPKDMTAGEEASAATACCCAKMRRKTAPLS